MKNLMNRVLVVLAVSALFAGNVDASQQKRGKKAAPTRMAKKSPARKTTAKIALSRMHYRAGGSFAGYPADMRKNDAAVLRQEVPSASKEVAILEKDALMKDDAARKTSFSTGSGRKAIAAIETAMLNGDLKDAVADLKDNPSANNAAKVATLQADATAAVSQLDGEVEGYKGYMTYRNLLMGTIAIASVAVTGYCIAYGAPTVLKPFVPQVVTDAAQKIYDATSATGAYLGLQEGGNAHKFGQNVKAKAGEYGSWFYNKGKAAAAAAAERAAGSVIGQKLGYMTTAQEAKLEQQIAEQRTLADEAYMKAQQKEEELQQLTQ